MKNGTTTQGVRTDPELLAPIEHRSEDRQAALAIIGSRRTLVAARTSLINRARALVKSFGSRLPPSDARSFSGKVRAHVPELLRPAVDPLLQQITSESVPSSPSPSH